MTVDRQRSQDISVIRQAVQAVTKILSDRNITVTQRGTNAFVEHDGNNRIVRVNIPYIPDNATPELVSAVQGFLDHEVAHLLFSDFDLLKKSQKQGFGQMHNIIEDTYIERQMERRFRGSEYNLDNVRRFYVEKYTLPKVTKAIADNNEKEIGSLLFVPIARAWSGQKVIREFIDANNFGDYEKQLLQVIGQELVDRIPECESSEDCFNLAKEIHKRMNEAREQQRKAREEKKRQQEEQQKREEQQRNKGADSDECDDADEGDSDDDAGSGEGSKNGRSSAEDKDVGDDSDQSPPDDWEDDGEEGEDEEDTKERGDSFDEDCEGEDDADADDEDGDEEPGQSDEEDDRRDLDSSDEGDDEELGDESADEDEGEGESESEGPEESDASVEVDTEGDEDELSGSVRGEDDSAEKADAGGRGEDDGDSDEVDFNSLDEDLETHPDDLNNDYDMDLEEWEKLIREDFDAQASLIISDMTAMMADDADYMPYTKDEDVVEVWNNTIDARSDECLRGMQERVDHMVGLISKEMERVIVARSQSRWRGGMRRGKLNSRALKNLAVGYRHPEIMDDRIFRQKEEHTSKDIAVQLIVDCSGSMTGRKIKTACESAYALSSVLERLRIPHEVIGFTTRPFGAEVTKEIYKEACAGRHYSREEALYMPIFKTFSERLTPEIRKRLAMFPWKGKLWNNIDGECLEIFWHRMLARQERGKLMIVLSDGAPAGRGQYAQITWHLKKVVKMIEASEVGIVGIGIGTNSVAGYYKHHVILDDVANLPGEVLGNLKKAIIANIH